ncbi:MAG: hypothetical protein KIT87_19560 [Anaerolineae bacterium]|nr:hypothetical protein [Anaerolineae bacterium]
MTHLDDGLLRRWLDEASRGFSLSQADQAHLAQCAHCQGRLADLQATAAFVGAALTAPVPPIDTTLALARLRQREADGRRKTEDGRSSVLRPPSSVVFERMLTVTQQSLMRRWWKPASVVAVLAALMLAVMYTPLGSYAQGILNLFTPKQFVAIPVTPQQMRTIPDLDGYGEMRNIQESTTRQVASAAEAAQAAGLTLLQPASLPSGLTANQAVYTLMGGGQAEFTFSAARAAQTAAQRGQTVPPMPATVDHSTLKVTIPTGVMTIYGDPSLLNQSGKAAPRQAEGARQPQGPRGPAASLVGSSFLAVAQMKAPTVTSSGATLEEIKTYLLSQPGIDPQLVASLGAITDPTSMLPIPIPVNEYNSHPVQVQGVQGLFVGDSSGLGSGVIWQKNGIVYAVGGAFREDEVLRIANSLQ